MDIGKISAGKKNPYLKFLARKNLKISNKGSYPEKQHSQ